MVRYGRKVPVSVICEFVGHYAPDKMPEELVEMILRAPRKIATFANLCESE
jgi:hypothetical protein